MDDAFIQRWIAPFYLSILHGNYAMLFKDSERATFNRIAANCLAEVTPKIAIQMIKGSWREAITGSWFARLSQFKECQALIGEKLLASKTCYAGQSHIFAMACYANDDSVDFLTRYLDRYLRKLDCDYDQDWAIGALMWLDRKHNTSNAEQFLVKDGLWDRFTTFEDRNSEFLKREYLLERISILIQYCRKHFQRPAI